jgi:SAM-dependent methyltransferase
VIYDIGGGYGEYAWWLTDKGYIVHLYDLSEKNIDMSAQLAESYPGCSLAHSAVADARNIPEPDESADAILLFGPLYHIVAYEQRQLAMGECMRLLKLGGFLFSAAITRYATTLWAVTTYGTKNELLGDPDFLEMIARELKDGQHIKKPATAYTGMGRSFFHLPDELKQEIIDAGFEEADVRGVIGPAWLVPNIDEQWQDDTRREHILHIVRMLEKEESIMGLSTHLVAIARKQHHQ